MCFVKKNPKRATRVSRRRGKVRSRSKVGGKAVLREIVRNWVPRGRASTGKRPSAWHEGNTDEMTMFNVNMLYDKRTANSSSWQDDAFCLFRFTRLTASFPGLGKPAPERLNQSGSKRWWGGSGISRTICKSFAPRFRQIITPATHHSIFYRLDALHDGQPIVQNVHSKVWKVYCITWSWEVKTDLPNSDDGVGDQNEKNDKRFDKRCHLVVRLFEPRQHLHTSCTLRSLHSGRQHKRIAYNKGRIPLRYPAR